MEAYSRSFASILPSCFFVAPFTGMHVTLLWHECRVWITQSSDRHTLCSALYLLVNAIKYCCRLNVLAVYVASFVTLVFFEQSCKFAHTSGLFLGHWSQLQSSTVKTICSNCLVFYCIKRASGITITFYREASTSYSRLELS